MFRPIKRQWPPGLTLSLFHAAVPRGPLCRFAGRFIACGSRDAGVSWDRMKTIRVGLTKCLEPGGVRAVVGHRATGAGGERKGDRGMVATGHPLATEAALDTLKRGGNAIDAALSAALVLGVVDGHNSGIGGGCVMVTGSRTDASLPSMAAKGRRSRLAGHVRSQWAGGMNGSQFGALSVATRALVAYNYAAVTYGRLPLRDLHSRGAVG